MLSALMALAALAGGAGAVDCPVSPEQLDARLVSALAAAEEGRYLDFEAERLAAEQAMDCVSEVLREQPLTNLHLVGTVRARLDGDRDALLASIRGLRVADPGFQLPQEWLSENLSLWQLFTQACKLGPGQDAPLPSRLVVDGQVASQHLPLERAAVVQVKNVSGSWSTWYVQPGELSATWLAAREASLGRPSEASAPVPVPVEGSP